MLVFNERTGEFEEHLGPGEKPSIGSSSGASNSKELPYYHYQPSSSSSSSSFSRVQVRERVIEILSDTLFVDADLIDDEDDIEDDLMADSLDAVELIEKFEQEFDIIILDEEAQAVMTVEDAIDLVCDNLNMDYDDFDDGWDDDDTDDDLDEDLDKDQTDDDDWDDFEEDDEDDDDLNDDIDDDEDNDDLNDKIDDEEDWDDDWDEEDDEYEDGDDEDWDDKDDWSADREREDIRKRVFAIVADKLSVDLWDINEDSYFTLDFGADSLDRVELIMALEKEFGIFIDNDEVESIETVGDAVDYIYCNT